MNMAELKELVPEFALLKDANLRETCEQIWLEALSAGGWESDNIKYCPAGKSLQVDCPESCITHCRRVVRLCDVAYQEMKDLFEIIGQCDHEILIAAALLHDVGKFVEHRWNGKNSILWEGSIYFKHPCIGAWYAKKYGLPDKVVHAILVHSDKLSPQGENAAMTPESLLLKKIDYLCWDYTALFCSREGK